MISQDVHVPYGVTYMTSAVMHMRNVNITIISRALETTYMHAAYNEVRLCCAYLY